LITGLLIVYLPYDLSFETSGILYEILSQEEVQKMTTLKNTELTDLNTFLGGEHLPQECTVQGQNTEGGYGKFI
jgi:hypothetical protein